MTNFIFQYFSMLNKRKTGISRNDWTMNMALAAFGKLKSGKFGENVVHQMVAEAGFTIKPKQTHTKITLSPLLQRCLGKKHFLADGYIPELDVYLESKMYAFNSGGTANEKLSGFLDKVLHYRKKCVLVLGGEFELDKLGESTALLAAAGLLDDDEITKKLFDYQDNGLENSFTVNNAKKLIDAGVLEIVRLSEFPMWLASQKTKELAAK